MNTLEFLQELKNHQIVPPEIMKKLRDKLEKTDKDVSAKSVAKYLIDKGYLSKYQAKQILSGASKAPEREALDLEVPAQQTEDTNELLKDLNPAATVASSAPEKTRAFTEQDAVNMAAPDVSIEVVDVEIEQTMQQGFDPAAAATQQGEFDPLGGNYDSHFGTVEEEVAPLESFAGKKAKKNQWDSKWIFIGSSILALLIRKAADALWLRSGSVRI